MTTMFATPIPRTLEVVRIPNDFWQMFCSKITNLPAFWAEQAKALPADNWTNEERIRTLVALIDEQAVSLSDDFYGLEGWCIAKSANTAQNTPFIYPQRGEYQVEVGGSLYELDGRLFGLVCCLHAYQEASFNFFESDPKFAERLNCFSYMLRKHYYEALTEYVSLKQSEGASRSYIQDAISLADLFHKLLD